MPKRREELLLEDIEAALARIGRYTAGIDRATFLSDEKTIDAAVRNQLSTTTLDWTWKSSGKSWKPSSQSFERKSLNCDPSHDSPRQVPLHSRPIHIRD